LGGDAFVQHGVANPYFSLFANSGNLTTFEMRVQVKDFFDDENIVPEEVREGFNDLVGRKWW
jgi:hypothetical protein